MKSLDGLRWLAANQARERVLVLGVVVSLVWLALVGLLSLIGPEAEGQGGPGWTLWLVGVLLPLGLIWLAVWSARTLLLLRQEAEDLRAMLVRMQGHDLPPPSSSSSEVQRDAVPSAESRAPAAARPAPPPRRTAMPAAPPPRSPADARQATLELDSPAALELTAVELFHALNFPDGPDDREAIRSLRLALSDPGMARLIRAAQDVVTLLAGQGVYMDELTMDQTDPGQWRRFAEGGRGSDVAGLAVIRDDAALRTAAAMMRGDEVFRDVAHHFLRHFDRLMSQKAQDSDPQLLAVLAEARSGRAFILLAQVSGMLGAGAEDEAPRPE